MSVGMTAPARKRRSRSRQMAALTVVLLLVWLGTAYLFMPALWRLRAHRRPSLAGLPRTTTTGNGIPGDPLNVLLVGTEAEVQHIILKAGWFPADPITLKSSLRIASASVLKRPFDEAPVSNLYLFGHKQDLAFQQAVNNNPRQRHHVRFWRMDGKDLEGRPVWIGAAIFDRRVGFSHTTGQITHRVDGDIDTERDFLFRDLQRTGELADLDIVNGFHTILKGKNGGGDPWFTDGRLFVGVISPSPTQ
jgi:hypothetical protein